MTFLAALWRVELRALLALLACAVLMAIYIAADAALGTTYRSASAGAALVAFSGTLFFGLPLAAIYGAPLYVWLMRTSALTWPRVLLVGALPAVPGAFIDREMAPLILVCGVVVAGLTHGLVLLRPLTMRWSGP